MSKIEQLGVRHKIYTRLDDDGYVMLFWEFEENPADLIRAFGTEQKLVETLFKMPYNEFREKYPNIVCDNSSYLFKEDKIYFNVDVVADMNSDVNRLKIPLTIYNHDELKDAVRQLKEVLTKIYSAVIECMNAKDYQNISVEMVF